MLASARGPGCSVLRRSAIASPGRRGRWVEDQALGLPEAITRQPGDHIEPDPLTDRSRDSATVRSGLMKVWVSKSSIRLTPLPKSAAADTRCNGSRRLAGHDRREEPGPHRHRAQVLPGAGDEAQVECVGERRPQGPRLKLGRSSGTRWARGRRRLWWHVDRRHPDAQSPDPGDLHLAVGEARLHDLYLLAGAGDRAVTRPGAAAAPDGPASIVSRTTCIGAGAGDRFDGPGQQRRLPGRRAERPGPRARPSEAPGPEGRRRGA